MENRKLKRNGEPRKHPSDYYKPSPWGPTAMSGITKINEGDNLRVDRVNETKMKQLRTGYWALGDVSLLDRQPLVCVMNRSWYKNRTEEEDETTKIVGERLAGKNVTVIHGNNHGAVKMMGRHLRGLGASQIIMPYYGLVYMKGEYGLHMANSVKRGETLIINNLPVHTPWSLYYQRKRNIDLGLFADVFIGIQVTDESMDSDTILTALRYEKPVYLMEPEGRQDFCKEDHEFFYKKGAIPFRLQNLDGIIWNEKLGQRWSPK